MPDSPEVLKMNKHAVQETINRFAHQLEEYERQQKEQSNAIATLRAELNQLRQQVILMQVSQAGSGPTVPQD